MRVSKMPQTASEHDNVAHSRDDGPSRRGFLRRAGLVGAATAAVIGGADVLGLTSASATTRSATTHRGTKRRAHGDPDCCSIECEYQGCGCKGVSGAGGNGCCDSGTCCYRCRACTGTFFHQCVKKAGCLGYNYCTSG